MRWKKQKKLLIIFISFLPVFSYAQSATTSENVLKSKIEERNNQIKQLEEEIKHYNNEVQVANSRARTLQNTIKTLDLTKKKISTDINLTEKKISKTSLTIKELNKDIDSTESHIDLNKKAIVSAFQNRQLIDDTGFFMMVLSNKNIHDIWNDLDNVRQVQEEIKNKSTELTVLEADLKLKQDGMENQKKNLVVLKQDLNGKKQAVEYTTKEKASILIQTKNKEQTFKELVKTKEEQKAQFEKEVYEFESQLNIMIDKGSYPFPKNAILSWPLDDIFITQKFGKTVGAEKLYTSGSHNGADFRASIGTRIKNVLDGVVVGTGNTDLYLGCYSFGKWVMVKHDNGLSTIYGHLSVISTSVGQQVNTGDVVGYSGNTGYSTGPHLHISVYATQGVRIEKYVNSKGCKEAIIPLADIKAYLDPLSYLPSI